MAPTEMVHQKQIEDRLRQFIVAETEWTGPIRRLTAEYDLIGNGVVDSMGIHQLVSFIQTEFGLEIGDAELRLENFESLERIGQLVTTKLTASAAG